MSNNVRDGIECFNTAFWNRDSDTISWFEDQWKIWPKRARAENTTNISFLYGGLLAYRVFNIAEPELSSEYKTHVEWMDNHYVTTE